MDRPASAKRTAKRTAKRVFALVFTLAAFGGGSGGGLAEASRVRYLPLEEMAREAHSVFTGEVVGVKSRWNARKSRIHTFVTVRVGRFLKGGRGGELVTLRVLGGEAEGYRLLVSGAPTFRLRERVLVFSEGGAGRVPTVLGLAAGKFTIREDPETGAETLYRSLRGLTLQGAEGGPVTSSVGLPRERLEFSEVERAVETALAGPRARSG